MNRIHHRSAFVVAGFLGVSLMARAGDFVMADLDVTILNDRMEMTETVRVSALDFNGDGRDDAVFLLKNASQVEIDIVFGGSEEKQQTLSSGLHILLPFARYNFSQTSGDLNVDGKEDLAMDDLDHNKVIVVFGRDQTKGELDVRGAGPDVTIPGTSGSVHGPNLARHVAMGDINANGIDDLILGIPTTSPLGRPGAGTVHVFFGGTSFPTGVINLLNANLIIYGKPNPLGSPPSDGHLGEAVTVADIDGDSHKDLILSAPHISLSGRPNAGEVYVLRGTTTWQTPLDLNAPLTSVTILGDNVLLRCQTAGDWTGDGKEELFVRDEALEGATVSDGRSTVDLAPGSPHFVETYSFGAYVSEWHLTDFDFDGRTDVFSLRYSFMFQPWQFNAFLSSDFPPGPLVADLSPPSFQIVGTSFQDFTTGDFNGDGFGDVLVSLPPATLLGYFGEFRILLGHRPLKNPTIRAARLSPDSIRTTLSLTVDGDPTEMKLSGDIEGQERDQWIPFQNSFRVNLTADWGTKTIQALFRNRHGRESALAQTLVALQPGDSGGLMEITNWVAPGGRAQWQMSVLSGGHFTARIYNKAGEWVTTVADENREAGGWSLEWNGLDETDRRVAPGIYVLVVEGGGGRWRKNVAVK